MSWLDDHRYEGPKEYKVILKKNWVDRMPIKYLRAFSILWHLFLIFIVVRAFMWAIKK